MKTVTRTNPTFSGSWRLPPFVKAFGIAIAAIVIIAFALAFIYFPAGDVVPNARTDMEPGSVLNVPAGYSVAGDIEVADVSFGDIVLHWTKYDDGRPSTGEIVVFNESARIRAISPATVVQGEPDYLAALLKQEGCETGCELVHTDYWDGPNSPNTLGVWALYQP